MDVDAALQSQIRNIEATYGKSLGHWFAVIDASGLTKQKPGNRPSGVRAAVHRAAGPVLRLAPRPPFLAGREELLAELGPAGQRRGHRAAGGGIPPMAEGRTSPG
jgi:hypothetical protein